jgi:hypothetical protein
LKSGRKKGSMSNSQSELNDWLRPEYKRSDFGEIIQGKYATTEVDFHQLTGALLACIGEDEGVKFMHYSIVNRLANHRSGDWTYEIDNANQITLRYRLSEFGSTEEAIINPPNVTTPHGRTELQDALLKGVMSLKTKVAALKEQQ